MDMAILEARQLVKKYSGRTVVDHINISFAVCRFNNFFNQNLDGMRTKR
jgi:ABC-type lipopolysaccharide export system ATPase subunit